MVEKSYCHCRLFHPIDAKKMVNDYGKGVVDVRSLQIVILKYRAEIDGLRAIAVLPVVFFHAGFELFSQRY